MICSAFLIGRSKNRYVFDYFEISKLYIVYDYNKQLLDEVFVICGIINVEVNVISRDEGEADNIYRVLDNSAYHKTRIQ